MIENNTEAEKGMRDRGAPGCGHCCFQKDQSLGTASMTVPAPNSTGPISVSMQLIEVILQNASD